MASDQNIAERGMTVGLKALNRVASFILHDLKNCVSMLALVTQNADRVGADPEFQRDPPRAMVGTVRKMRALLERLSGGEATQALADALAKLLNLKAELSDPFRSLPTLPNLGRRGQWDVAMGLAMKDVN